MGLRVAGRDESEAIIWKHNEQMVHLPKSEVICDCSELMIISAHLGKNDLWEFPW
jgi:hypothetical protein